MRVAAIKDVQAQRALSRGLAGILTDMEESEQTSTGHALSDDEALKAFSRMPSSCPALDIELRKFGNEEVAKRVATAVHGWLHACGKFMNLKRLLRVTVAYDYDQALAEIDRGAGVVRPLTATNDGVGVGIAMTPTVLHDGELRSVMVLNATYMMVLVQDETPELAPLQEQARYTLAHESGHVHDLGVRAASFPDTILKAQPGFRDGTLFLIASGCWEEYIACRLSAFMGKDATLRAMEDTFCKALETAKSRADSAIREYRLHTDVQRVSEEVVQQYRRLMVYASYLLGHVDGLELAVENAAPQAVAALESHSYFKPVFSRLQGELRSMHGKYGDWKGVEVFGPLKQLAYEFLKSGGLDIQSRPEGAAYVVIPMTPETTPSLRETLDFFRSKNSAGGN
jgi:hypothetical protein